MLWKSRHEKSAALKWKHCSRGKPFSVNSSWAESSSFFNLTYKGSWHMVVPSLSFVQGKSHYPLACGWAPLLSTTHSLTAAHWAEHLWLLHSLFSNRVLPAALCIYFSWLVYCASCGWCIKSPDAEIIGFLCLLVANMCLNLLHCACGFCLLVWIKPAWHLPT